MKDHDEDEKLEQYLRSFRLRATRPISLSRPRRIRIGIAAVIASAALVTSFVALRPHPKSVRRPAIEVVGAKNLAVPVTVMQLSAALRNGDLDSTLAQSAQEILPPINSSQSALHVLAKE